MKVLFVSSGNSTFGINPIIENQLNSLLEKGIEVDHYAITGKGWINYLRNKNNISKKLRKSNYNIVHAHYGIWGFLLPWFSKKIRVVSLMGSDVYTRKHVRWLIRMFSLFIWDATICKSEKMRDILKVEKTIVIPNGVNFERLKPIEKSNARRKLKLKASSKYILFVSVFNNSNPSKNFHLAKKAINLLNDSDIELLNVHNVKHEDLCYYYSASDLLLMTSKYEGSPNAIKEAMACNLPIVSTNVGDVEEIISGTAGCFIADSTPQDIANKIMLAINYGRKTNGRRRITHLDESIIAERIIQVYQKCLLSKV